MKKFTGNFLLGEHGLGNVLRKVGLSMVAILMTVAVFAQPQDTYHVFAENVSDCYRADNDYEVQISFRDFVKIDAFKLVLKYDDDVFSFVDYDILVGVLEQGGDATVDVEETSAGVLTFTWDVDDPEDNGTLEPNNDTIPVITLHFALNGFPIVWGPANQWVFDTDLDWDQDESMYWNVQGQVTEILTENFDDGSITVEQMFQEIELAYGAADCAGENALVTVTVPDDAGLMYSWNGSTFTSNPSSNINAPSTGNTLRIKDGDCISYIYRFDVDAPEVLGFDYEPVVETECPDGLGDIEVFAYGGNMPYTYYLLTEAEYDDLPFDECCDCIYNACIDNEYSTGIFQVPVGTYYVIVTDANNCISLCEDENWKMVEVVDNNDPWEWEDEVLDLQCYDQPEGKIWLGISGATPFDNDDTEEYGYKVWFDGAYLGVVDFEELEDGMLLWEDLAAGDYDVIVQDARGCEWSKTYTVDEPDPIMFDITHTDASCENPIGTIILDWQNITGGTFNDLTGGSYTGNAEWAIDTRSDYWNIFNTTQTGVMARRPIDEPFINLPPGVYYIMVFDEVGCYNNYMNEQDDDAVKILEYDFDIVYDDNLCGYWDDDEWVGETTSVQAVLKTGSGEHDFEFKLWTTDEGGVPQTELTGWQTSSLFDGDDEVGPGYYAVQIHDITDDCFYVIPFVVDASSLRLWWHMPTTLPPTCPGNSDGNLSVYATGGIPFIAEVGGNEFEYYEFKLDDNPWVQASEFATFAIDTAEHLLTVRDADGCTYTMKVDWPNNENIIEFQDTIWNDCALAEINLFNKYPEGCELMFQPDPDEDPVSVDGMHWPVRPWLPHWYDCDTVEWDYGYLEHFEWYGIGIEHFTGALTFDILIWTSDSGWVTRTLQGIQQLREPLLYWTDVEPTSGQDVVDTGDLIYHNTAFGAGTYWIVAKDEWGCFSNIEEITIIDPPALDVVVEAVDAGCDGSTDGIIKFEGFNGKYRIPNLQKPFARYQYVLTQQPQIFTQPNWVDQVTWVVFSGTNSFANDSVAAINVQAGTYYLAVRDWCGVENTDLIWFSDPIVIEDAAPVEVNWDIAQVADVTCAVVEYEWDDDEYTPINVFSNDGSLTNLLDATTGGFGDYTYTLMWHNTLICTDTFDVIREEALKSASATYLIDGMEYEFPMVNKTGEFVDLPAGQYTLLIEDDSLGCWAEYPVDICRPEPLLLTPIVVNPSCNDAHDGILRYVITGGRAPFMEATNNVGIWESAADIPMDRWVDTSSEDVPVAGFDPEHDAWIFDRRVRAGEYDIWIKDANGCIYHIPVPVVVDEPDVLQITDVSSDMVSCNDQNELYEGETGDGSVTFTPVGGWDMDDDFLYYAEIWAAGGTAPFDTQTFDELMDDITFYNLDAGDYVIKLYEYNEGIWENPVISYVDYFESHDWLAWPCGPLYTGEDCVGDNNIYQNPFLSLSQTEDACFVTYDVTVSEPEPIVYDWEVHDVICHDTHTGKIMLSNIAGGTPGGSSDLFQGYLVGLEGPADYDPTAQVVASGTYSTTDEGIVWWETVDDEFEFNNLIWGHYTIHVRDINGCWIFKESLEVENPPLLVVNNIQLLENVKCHGDTTGIVKLFVSGGVPPYEYAVGDANYAFPVDFDEQAYFDGLVFKSMSDTLYVPAGVWVAYVRDANGCIAGFPTDMMGQPVVQHRVSVLEPDAVEGGDFGYVGATCYAEEDGAILIDELWGGNGGAWMVKVWGTSAMGDAVMKQYVVEDDPALDVVLNGLPASIDSSDLKYYLDEGIPVPDSMKYKVVIMDSEGCESDVYMQYVSQPDPFIITLKSKQDAFICPNDLSGLYEIEVVSGGRRFGVDGNGKDIFEFKWEAYEVDPVENPEADYVDELSDDQYGFVRTFLGYAGYYYRVYARDVEGCETTKDTFIVSPNAIDFEVKDVTCWGAEKASAKITATFTNGRKWHVLYKEIEGDLGTQTPANWTVYDGWAEEGGTILMADTLIYDTENLEDVHYIFVVEDSLGCRSEPDTLTFDIVQHELIVTAGVTVPGECTSEVDVQVTGGTEPYMIELNGNAITEGTMTLDPGSYTVSVVDDHECTTFTSFEVVADPVAREAEVVTYIGETVAFADAEAGVDEMLAEGVYVYTYTHTNGCERTLTVTVVGVPRVLTILEIQGEADASPWVDAVVEVTATVTGVVENEGFFMQDANGAWNGIWVEYSDVSADGIQKGNGVVVVGEVAEVASVTSIIATSVVVGTPPVTITAETLSAPSDVENEMYESVLVWVKGARATGYDAGSGEWTIYYETTDDVVVNDLMYAYMPTDGTYYNVRGVVNGRLDAFKLEPRIPEDIEDLSLTGIEDPVNVQFKVYPNPFNDRIYIDNFDKLTRVVVSNIAGQRVIDVEYPSREIRTANLVSGVYVVSLYTENGIAKTERIVKR